MSQIHVAGGDVAPSAPGPVGPGAVPNPAPAPNVPASNVPAAPGPTAGHAGPPCPLIGQGSQSPLTIQSLSPEEVQAFADVATRITTNVGSVVLGKPEAVRLALTGLFAEGHLLIEDVPGVGKTTLARAMAASVR